MQIPGAKRASPKLSRWRLPGNSRGQKDGVRPTLNRAGECKWKFQLKLSA